MPPFSASGTCFNTSSTSTSRNFEVFQFYLPAVTAPHERAGHLMRLRLHLEGLAINAQISVDRTDGQVLESNPWFASSQAPPAVVAWPAPAGVSPPEGGAPEQPPPPVAASTGSKRKRKRYSPRCARFVLELLGERKCRLSRKKILAAAAARQVDRSDSSFAHTLAEMVKRGELSRVPGEGYGFVEQKPEGQSS